MSLLTRMLTSFFLEENYFNERMIKCLKKKAPSNFGPSSIESRSSSNIAIIEVLFCKWSHGYGFKIKSKLNR